MVHFVNYRLELRRADGMRAREVNYWILGRPRAPGGARTNRKSLLRGRIFGRKTGSHFS